MSAASSVPLVHLGCAPPSDRARGGNRMAPVGCMVECPALLLCVRCGGVSEAAVTAEIGQPMLANVAWAPSVPFCSDKTRLHHLRKNVRSSDR